MQTWFAPLKQKFILLGLIGGFSLRLTVIFQPLVLFSGQHLFNPMLQDAIQLGFWVLLLTGLARFVLTSITLNTGWKGGQFLPIMFAVAVQGLAFSTVFPIIPASTVVISAMGGLIAIVLPDPIVALILMGLMFR